MTQRTQLGIDNIPVPRKYGCPRFAQLTWVYLEAVQTASYSGAGFETSDFGWLSAGEILHIVK